MSFIKTLQIAKQFSSSAYADESLKSRRKQEQKAMLNALFSPAFSSRWFQLLKEDRFRDYFSHRDQLYMKPYRPYINTNWNKDKTVKVIGDSIKFLETKTNFTEDFKNYKDILFL